jgi:hypothetical protein
VGWWGSICHLRRLRAVPLRSAATRATTAGTTISATVTTDAFLVLVLMVILGKRWQVVLFRRRRGGESSVGGIRVRGTTTRRGSICHLRRLRAVPLRSAATRATTAGTTILLLLLLLRPCRRRIRPPCLPPGSRIAIAADSAESASATFAAFGRCRCDRRLLGLRRRVQPYRLRSLPACALLFRGFNGICSTPFSYSS